MVDDNNDLSVSKIWKGADGGHPVPEVMGKIDVSMPGEGMIMDYVYHFKQKGSWRYYPDMVRQMKNEVGITLLVPTLDSVRYMHIIDIHVKVHFAVQRLVALLILTLSRHFRTRNLF